MGSVLVIARLSAVVELCVGLCSGCYTDPVNMPPSVRIDAPPEPFFRGQAPLTYTATASDPDGDAVTLEWVRTTGACQSGFDVPAAWPTKDWTPGKQLVLMSKDTTAAFCVWVKATDRYGAVSVDARTGDPQDHAPVAVLELVSPANGPSFPVHTTFVLSGAKSTDPDTGDTLHFGWSLKASPSTVAAFAPCPGQAAPAVQCLTADAAGDYQVELSVDDGSMASIVDKTLHVLPGQLPTAALELVSPTGAPPFPLGAQVRVTGAHSTGGDPTLTFDWGALEPPTGSTASLGDCQADPTSDTRCFTADVAGTYRVTLIVDNQTGASAPVSATVEVAPDQPPCLDHTTPSFEEPMTSATTFVVDLVSDDLDSYPPTAIMQWFVSDGTGPFVPAEKDFPSFSLNPLAYSVGDLVRVRLEIRDRDTARADTEFLACGDADICSASSLIHPDACVQRVTWQVHILP